MMMTCSRSIRRWLPTTATLSTIRFRVVSALVLTGAVLIVACGSSESGNDVAYGVGAEFAFNPSFALTADWRRYSLDDADIDFAMLGLVLRFGEAN